LVYSDASKID